MKLQTVSSIALAITLALGVTTFAATAGAKHHGKGHERGDKNTIEVIAKSDSDIKVRVRSKGAKNAYSFTADELTNMSNVESKLDDLTPEAKAKVIDLLAQLGNYDAKHVVLKSSEMKRGDRESQMLMVKTGNGEDAMHIEIDVEGDAANLEHKKRMHEKMKDRRHDKRDDKRGSKNKKRMNKEHLKKMVAGMMKRDKLDDNDIAELKAILDGQTN